MKNSKTLKPITLETRLITLEPMILEHIHDFYLAGNHTQIWQYMPSNRCLSLAIAKAWIEDSINEMTQGLQIPFVIKNKATDKIIGSTRLFNYIENNNKIEIGHTFITPEFQRSYVNSHAKYLMLMHAFEHLAMARVEICTHEDNQQSRHAIARIGGHFEGILRKSRRLPNGNYRNTALFSIIDDEWPHVKQHLLNTTKNPAEFTHVSR